MNDSLYHDIASEAEFVRNGGGGPTADVLEEWARRAEAELAEYRGMMTRGEVLEWVWTHITEWDLRWSKGPVLAFVNRLLRVTRDTSVYRLAAAHRGHWLQPHIAHELALLDNEDYKAGGRPR